MLLGGIFMRRLVKIFSLFTLLFLLSFVAGCGKKIVNLTLDENISANVDDLDNIKKNTSITIIIDIPEDKLIHYITINGKRVDLRVGYYSFKITKNTTIKAYFKDMPEKQYYKLTLPDNVSADITELDNILEKTRITLTILTPEDKALSQVKLNGTPVKVVKGVYSFLILSDTVVEVFYSQLDDYSEATFSDVLDFFALLDTNFIKAGTVEINLYNNDFHLEGLAQVNDSFGITNFSFTAMVFDEQSYDEFIIYSDGFYIYIDKSVYDNEGNLISNEKTVEVLNLESNSFDLFKNVYLEDFFIFVEGEYSIEEIIDIFIKHIRKILLDNLELLSYISFEKNGNYFKASTEIDKPLLTDLLDLFFFLNIDQSLLEDDFSAAFDLVFVDYTFLSAHLALFYDEQVNFTTSIKYVNKSVNIPFDLADFDLSLASYYTYYVHLNDDLVDEVNISTSWVDYLLDLIDQYPFSDQILNILVPAQNGLIVEGFYTDENYTNKLKLNDLKTDNLHIYIKWIPL